jgi:hypothetical protein
MTLTAGADKLNPEAAHGFSATVSIRVEGRPFHAQVTDGEFHLSGGEPDHPTATLDTTRQTLAGLLYGAHSLDDARHSGEATITGPAEVVARFLELFPLPEPADLR